MYQGFAYTVLTVVTLASLIPLIYVVSMSLVNEKEWIERGGFILLPHSPTLLAYERLFKGDIFPHALIVSVIRTILGTALMLTMTTIAGYIVSRRALPGRRAMLFAVLITVLFNGGLIPTYLVVRDTHLLDSIWALVIPGLIDSWSVLVIKQFFENIPSELEESAQMDGAGEIVLMIRLMLPMSKPVIAAIGLFTAVFHWNSWFDALIYIKDPHLQPLQLIMRNMFANVNIGSQMNPSSVLNPTQRVSMESLKMAVAVVGTIPILCVYPFIQKHFTKGMFLGAVKG
ncbi:carbohydrate ABC transporter permease [Cohnella silvisoli]|uniref:Carbohydrate ABC transporter permease n=1 Tax=Cohnella silvisoli TaxID=2873699 RepID=A0ABV1KSN2_9BACL|nr:carbohydrate ABC transporter permease [Cohnella silvisoli]